MFMSYLLRSLLYYSFQLAVPHILTQLLVLYLVGFASSLRIIRTVQENVETQIIGCVLFAVSPNSGQR